MIGKSASGKTFVRDKLVKEHGYKSLVTFTSRPPRKGEKQDITYHFISQEDFEQKIEDGFFTEWKKYDTEQSVWYYGTALTDCYDADDDIGTSIEVYEANRLNIPVIAYSDVLDAKKGDIFDKIHPWIKECLATKLMFHADDVVQYVKDFYMVRY